MSRVHLIRLVIETTSPMVISSGERETAFDNALARDANGLPYIPATAIAGVWRSLVTKSHPKLADLWFGTQRARSLLQINSANLHTANNQPVYGLVQPEQIAKDPVLSRLSQNVPHHRDRVAINDRGVAKDTAKFEQIMLPSGLRFSTTIKWHEQQDKNAEQRLQELQYLLLAWSDRRMAFGASTRNGLGQIKVVASAHKIFDLQQGPKAGQDMQAMARFVPAGVGIQLASAQGSLLADIPLQALDTWRCGAGSMLLGKAPATGSVGIISYSEPSLVWQNNQAHWQEHKPVLCGSSIKGILAHRLAFHYRRHAQIFAEQMADASHEEWQKRPDELGEVLGFIAEAHEDSRAGVLYVDDSPITFKNTVLRTHNAIDRFTGGVIDGALYTEELLHQPSFRVRLWLAQDVQLSSALKAALIDTLNDLTEGLLPLGAGSGRGNSLVQLAPNQPVINNAHLLNTKQEVA